MSALDITLIVVPIAIAIIICGGFAILAGRHTK